MARYPQGPGGIRVQPVDVRPGNVHWIFVILVNPDVQPGEVWYLVTRDGAAVGRLPSYFQLHELTDLLETLGLNLTDLREAGDDTDTGIA
jgi:hypothetical protein